MQTGDIQSRDPFVLPVPEHGCYYLYGATGKNCWGGPGVGEETGGRLTLTASAG